MPVRTPQELWMLADPPHTIPVPADRRQSPTALAVARGTARLMVSLGLSTVSELSLASGRRADMVALGGAGEVWIVEIKSSIADFRADHKWPDYRLHCDRLYFATALDVPVEIFPEDAGLIVADAFGAHIVREAPEHRMAGATRRSMMLRFAHAAASRLHVLTDPAASRLHALTDPAASRLDAVADPPRGDAG